MPYAGMGSTNQILQGSADRRAHPPGGTQCPGHEQTLTTALRGKSHVLVRPGQHFPIRSPGALQRTQLEGALGAACLHLKYPKHCPALLLETT